MFHSSDSSKLRNFSFVMMSAAGLTRFSVPSTTCHPDGIESIFQPRHPAVVLPSNNRRQPAARSSGVSVLSGAAPPAEPACWAAAAPGAANDAPVKHTPSRLIAVRWFTCSSSRQVSGGWASMLRYPRGWGRGGGKGRAWGGKGEGGRASLGKTGQLLQAALHGPPGTLAPRDDEDRVVACDGPDDLVPPCPIDGKAERLGSPRRRLDHEQRAHALHGHEHRRQDLIEVMPDARPAFRGWRVVRAPVGGGDLGQP